MLHLQVMLPEITIEERTELVKNLTDTVANILGLPPEQRSATSVQLTMYGKNEVSRGGILVKNGNNRPFHMNLLLPGLPYHQKRELVQHLTNALCETLKIKVDLRHTVFVTIQEFSLENLGAGGRVLAELVHT